ncbi:hypothetical protein BsWGS_03720 [Bradybaena similaris]
MSEQYEQPYYPPNYNVYRPPPLPQPQPQPRPPTAYQRPVGYRREPAQRTSGSTLGRSILWFLALVFFGWPVAFLISPVYILLSPFGPCCQCVRVITDALLIGVQLPCICSENMLNGEQFC